MKRSSLSPRDQDRLVIRPETMCVVCNHPRSSHSVLVIMAACKAQDCACDSFEPVCGCGHVISWHQWGNQPHPWSCDKCLCMKFGAAPEQSQVFQQSLFDMRR